MGKKLAIRGHSTRGKEVIELLEMMGGENSLIISGNKLSGYEQFNLYYINDNGVINYKHHSLNKNMILFTLEEFLEKYPFKVGDKVVYTKYGDNCDDYPLIIKSMKWTGTTIEYAFDGYVTCLSKDLKMWTGEPNTVISGIYLNSCDYADEVELNLGDYAIEVRDGRTFAVKKKPKYPKTFDECLNVLYCKSVLRTIIGHKAELLLNLEMLLICRDAYWKIAGEEMGLDKPWNPKYGCGKWGYWIGYDINANKTYCQDSRLLLNRLLVFPTKEMRDVFYDNFKNLIEQCKELL